MGLDLYSGYSDPTVPIDWLNFDYVSVNWVLSEWLIQLCQRFGDCLIHLCQRFNDCLIHLFHRFSDCFNECLIQKVMIGFQLYQKLMIGFQ